MLFPKHSHKNNLYQPLLSQKHNKQQNPRPRLLNKRNSIILTNNQFQTISKNIPSLQRIDIQPPATIDVSQQLVNSAADLTQQFLIKKDIPANQKKSIKVQFNKKRKQKQPINKQKQTNKLNHNSNNLPLSQSIYEKFQQQGLRIKSNWAIPTKTKYKSFNSQIMNLDPRIQYFLYYMNLMLNTIFRLSLIAIFILMIVYQEKYDLMEMIVAMQILTTFLYCLAMIKMLYTKKDEQSIYLQKHFTDRDITDIQMDRVLRKHFTWKNILMNISSLFKMNSKFKTDIKISILRQEIFKRIQIVLCFIPFTVIFFATPNTFRFQCDYPVQIIVTGTICLEFVRMTVHYIVIFIEN